MTLALELALIAFVVITAVFAALLRDVLGSIAVFAAFSLGLAIIWVLLQAPDVALTEAAVGAGVMTFLFLLTISKTTHPDTDRPLEELDLKAIAVVAAVALLMLTTVPAMPEVGDPTAPSVSAEHPTGEQTPYSYYIENTYVEAGIRNAVAGVLVVYRGFDTFGEAVVVFAAAVGVMVVLKREVMK